MKKVVYAVMACLIIAGIIIIATIGLNADIIYSKNVEIDVYIGQTINKNEIEDMVKEIFPNKRFVVQEIELFQDMVAITLPDDMSEEELNSKVEELNTKVNEKYGLENTVEEDIDITHNPKVRLSSLIWPYVLPVGISFVIILLFVGIRYKELGIVKIIVSYILSAGIAELLFLSILAITRFPINGYVIPVSLVLLVAVLTVLGLKNEKMLAEKYNEQKKKK